MPLSPMGLLVFWAIIGALSTKTLAMLFMVLPRTMNTTQRGRYAWVVVSLVGAAQLAYWPLVQYGPHATYAMLAYLSQAHWYGWLIIGLYIAVLANPVLSALTALWIHSHPSFYARKVYGTT